MVWFSMTSVRPKRCCSAAICAGQMRIGSAERGRVRGGAEPGAGRGRRVGGDRRAEDRGGHGDRDEREDQQLLTPFAAEQPPGPADHGAPGGNAPVPASRLGGALAQGRGHGTLARREKRFGTGGGRRLVDRPPVAQEHHPVRPRGQLRVVRHHHRGHTPLAGVVDQPHDRLRRSPSPARPRARRPAAGGGPRPPRGRWPPAAAHRRTARRGSATPCLPGRALRAPRRRPRGRSGRASRRVPAAAPRSPPRSGRAAG